MEPACVQVMLHDEDDGVFSLWMLRDGALVEVGIPVTHRVHITGPPEDADPGVLLRTGLGRGERLHAPVERRPSCRGSSRS